MQNAATGRKTGHSHEGVQISLIQGQAWVVEMKASEAGSNGEDDIGDA